VRAELDRLLRDALREVAAFEGLGELADVDPQIDRTRDARHGDFTSNTAMRIAKDLGRKPRDLAAALVAAMPPSPLVERVEVAGPGFINFTLSDAAYHDELKSILARGDDYGRSDVGAGRRMLVEYVSANPTGPLHVGHGRLAAQGASVANLLRATGHGVDEEYYVNDAGRQMEILAASVWLRYAELDGADIPFPGNAYQGDYVREIAAELKRRYEDRFVRDADLPPPDDGDAEQRMDAVIAAVKSAIGEADFKLILGAALDSVLSDIKEDLAEFSVTPQRWYSEQSLTETGAVDAALAQLEANGLLYEQEGATWFRTTAFGDDKDRVVVRENGAKTYFASDIAYHMDKCRRGYDLLLNVLGADHHGYVPRIRASLLATGEPSERLEVQIVQFVVLYRGRVKAQMSTRSGEYVTLRELREEVGNDAARFFYVSRSNDQHLEFDLDLAKSRSNENPVYYVQYAHARVASVLRKMEEEGLAPPDVASTDLGPLSLPEEREMLLALSRYPEIVQTAAEQRAPQHIVHYLRDLAGSFHAYYNAHRVLVDDRALRDARLVLALGLQRVIRNALALLGVGAPQQM
jgi:arginyl-tRNA synthetase